MADPLEAASAHLAAGDTPAAIAALSREIDAGCADARLWALRGRLWRLGGQPGRALADLTVAIRLQPDDPYPRGQKAWVLWALGERRAAKALLRRVGRRHPDWHWSFAFLAQQQLVTHRFRAGLRVCERALALASGCPYTNRIAGDLLANVGAYPRAIACLERATAAAPGDALAHAELGLTRGHAGDYPGGIGALSRAIELAPRTRHLWRDRAALALLAGDPASAVRDYRRLLELSADEPVIRARLVRLDGRSGEGAAPRWQRRALLAQVGIMEQTGEPLR